MLRRKQIAGLAGAAVGFGFILWALASTNLPERISQMFASAPSPDTAAMTAPAPDTSRKSADPAKSAERARAAEPLAIEIARVEAGGPSVLAGRSPPNHRVTVLANGREIATVVASDEGQWSAIIADGIAAGPLELKLSSQPKDGGQVVTSASRQLTVPAPAAPKMAAAAPQSAPQAPPVKASAPATATATPQPPVTTAPTAKVASAESGDKKALADFEALVARTRKEMGAAPASTPASQAAVIEQPQGARANNTPAQTAPGGDAVPSAAPQRATAAAGDGAPADAAPKPTTMAAAPPATVAPSPLATTVTPTRTAVPVEAPIPVPITFVTDDTELTPDGARAAALLAEYLRLKRPDGISLSGHADSRGPDSYNMELSRKRLEAIEAYLRNAGYTGKLSLLPRGKREPYSGIDRSRLPREEVYQADRRVELRLTP